MRRWGRARTAADGHCAAALFAYQAGDLAAADAEIALALELLPGHAEYYAVQGLLWLRGGQKQPAAAAFDRALAVNPYEMAANYGRGVLAYGDKDWDAAAGFFLNALAAQPARPETQYYLALVKHRQGSNGAALKWMREAQAGFVKAADRRAGQCAAWAGEFEKLLAEAAQSKMDGQI